MNRSAWAFVVCAAMSAGCRGANGKPARVEETAPRAVARTQVVADPFAFDAELFEKKREAQPDDWLASFHEPGQTFAAYAALPPKGLTDKRHTIVLQPIGEFSTEEHAALEKLREFTSAYFQLPARVAKPVALPDHGFRQRRMGGLAWTQYSTLDLMKDVLLPRLPADAVCYLGITMSDLYPDEDWNFVFGQASFDKRVGVYSLVRYTNRFWGRPQGQRI